MYDFFTHVPRLLARAKVVLVLRDVPGSIFGGEGSIIISKLDQSIYVHHHTFLSRAL